MVQLLSAAGADLNAVDALLSCTPLHYAVECGHHEAVRVLIEAGCNINYVGRNCGTSLYAAASKGKIEMVQVLLRNGAEPRLAMGPWAVMDSMGPTTTLLAAAESGHTGVVQLLLEAWGQPPASAANLVVAAQAATQQQQWTAFAVLAKELWQRHPAELFLGQRAVAPAAATAAVLDAWASDVRSLGEQQAAVRKREEAVALEAKAVQRQIVQIACLATVTQCDQGDMLHSLCLGAQPGSQAEEQ
jgi:hypothetical protein